MADFIVRALATLVGALAAFGLAAWRQRSEERRGQIEKFKTALFILILQRTFLRNLQSQRLAPKREHPIRAYVIPPILSAPSTESLDIKALDFLLGAEGGELMNGLAVAEAKYRTLVALVEARNAVHLKFQEKLEAAQEATQMSEGTLEDIRRIAGPVISKSLEQMTDDLYQLVDDAIRFNRDVYVSAVATYKRLFPGTGMFGVEDLPLSQGSEDAA